MIRKLVFKSDPAELAGVRAEVRRFLKAAGCTETDASRITVALSEACTNITRHTYDGDTTRTIRLTCEAKGCGIRFRLRDYGPHVRAAQLRPRPSRELKPGGLGLVLIRKTFDSIQLVNHPRGNELILEFRWAPAL